MKKLFTHWPRCEAMWYDIIFFSLHFGYAIYFFPANVDIFVCIHFRGFTQISIFAWINIRVLRIKGSLGIHNSNFHGVHIFREYLRRANYAKICTARKLPVFFSN